MSAAPHSVPSIFRPLKHMLRNGSRRTDRTAGPSIGSTKSGRSRPTLSTAQGSDAVLTRNTELPLERRFSWSVLLSRRREHERNLWRDE